MTTNIKVVDRKGEAICDLQVEINMTVENFKKLFAKESGKKLSVLRMRFEIVGSEPTVALTDKTKELNHYFQDPQVTLKFKDLGPQVSWTTVFLVEYGGPIAIILLLLYFRKGIYGSDPDLTYNQKLGVGMGLGHYIKREFETLFVHKFSNDTMPMSNIFKNSIHYWILFGFFTMYFYLHPNYTPPAWANDNIFTASAVIFTIWELLNLKAHLILSGLRKPGTTQRGIPEGWGFGMVSCANYLYEALAWTTFAIQAQVLGGYLFLLLSVY